MTSDQLILSLGHWPPGWPTDPSVTHVKWEFGNAKIRCDCLGACHQITIRPSVTGPNEQNCLWTNGAVKQKTHLHVLSIVEENIGIRWWILTLWSFDVMFMRSLLTQFHVLHNDQKQFCSQLQRYQQQQRWRKRLKQAPILYLYFYVKYWINNNGC